MKENQKKMSQGQAAIIWFCCIFPCFIVGSLFGGIIIGSVAGGACVLFFLLSIIGVFIVKPKKA